MQGSHLAATLRASAINSLVFLSSTPFVVAARPRSLKLLMTSGVLDLNVEMPVETDCVSSRKLLVRSVIAFSLDTQGLVLAIFGRMPRSREALRCRWRPYLRKPGIELK